LLLFICHDIIYFLYNCIYLICITTVNLPNESLRLPQLKMWPFDLFSVTRLYCWQVDLSMTWHVDDLICLPWLLSKYNINMLFCIFSLFNFSSIFPGGGSADPIFPCVRTPVQLMRVISVCIHSGGRFRSRSKRLWPMSLLTRCRQQCSADLQRRPAAQNTRSFPYSFYASAHPVGVAR